jgi:5-methylthioadenosine/S-adenosylhomocysteine deaminase
MPIYYYSEYVLSEGRFRPLYLGVEDDKIISVSADLPPSGSTVVDYGLYALMPGAVNTHTHSFQSLRRGCADGKPLEEWLRAIYSASQDFGEEQCYLGGLVSFAEMLRAGTTTVADFFYLNGRGNSNCVAVIKAAEDLGIRLVMGRTFMDADWGGAATRETIEEATQRYEELMDVYKNRAQISVCPAPHSIYGASRPLIEAAYELAKKYDSQWYMHLADSKASAEQIATKYKKRSVELLKEWDILDENFVGIHAMWLSELEIDLLAESGASVSHNPASNMILGERIIDLPELWEHDICVGLGTDGAASNNALNLFRDARLASLAQKLRAQNPTAVNSDQMMRLITKDGGALLGLPIGELATGFKADFVVLDRLDVSLQPTSALTSNIIHAMSERAIKDVYCGGKKVVEDGELTNMDFKEVCKDLHQMVNPG